MKALEFKFLIKTLWEKSIIFILYGTFFSILFLFFYCWYKCGISIDKMYQILTPLSILVTFIAYRQTLNQQKKEHVNEVITSILDEIQKNRKILIKNDTIGFVNFTKTSTLIPYAKIHEWICEKNEKNELKIESDGLCKMNNKGMQIRTSIINIINSYEKLAIGIYYGGIDEKIAYDSLNELVLKNYTIFSDYIKHRREYHHDKTAWIFFEWLYKRWERKS